MNNNNDINDIIKEIFEELHIHDISPYPDGTSKDVLFIKPKKIDIEFPPKIDYKHTNFNIRRIK